MYNFNFPLCCEFESGLLNNIVDKIKSKFPNNKKMLIVTDEFLYNKYTRELLEEKFNAYNIYNKVILVELATFEIAKQIGEVALEEDFDTVIGVGGGKVQDICKYASFISKKDFISIPTAIANDGVCSPIAVLQMKDGYTKSIGTKLPIALFIDIDVIIDAPMDLIKAGIGDVASNYTAIYDWQLASKENDDKINDFALVISDISFNAIYNMKYQEKIKDKEFIKQLAQAIVLSGIAMSIAGTSRPCSGSEHLFSHTIDRLYKKRNLHGYQVALGAIVSAYLQGRDYKMIMQLLKRYNINVKPQFLNLSYEEFCNCWLQAKESRKDRYTILNKISDAQLKSKLKEIYDIIEGEM